MKLSPVQLIESYPIKVSVEYNPNADEKSYDSGDTIGMSHLTKITRMVSEDSEDDRVQYFVVLGVRSWNDDGLEARYSFEVVFAGRVSIRKGSFQESLNIDDVAARYAFTMLYGQIRETVSTITARMKDGLYMLPTMSFMDATFEGANRLVEESKKKRSSNAKVKVAKP